jgi:hypothetical protein
MHPEDNSTRGYDAVRLGLGFRVTKRDSLKLEKAISGSVYVCSISFHRQNVLHVAGLSCKRELYACSSPTHLSKFDCTTT